MQRSFLSDYIYVIQLLGCFVVQYAHHSILVDRVIHWKSVCFGFLNYLQLIRLVHVIRLIRHRLAENKFNFCLVWSFREERNCVAGPLHAFDSNICVPDHLRFWVELAWLFCRLAHVLVVFLTGKTLVCVHLRPVFKGPFYLDSRSSWMLQIRIIQMTRDVLTILNLD